MAKPEISIRHTNHTNMICMTNYRYHPNFPFSKSTFPKTDNTVSGSTKFDGKNLSDSLKASNTIRHTNHTNMIRHTNYWHTSQFSCPKLFFQNQQSLSWIFNPITKSRKLNSSYKSYLYDSYDKPPFSPAPNSLFQKPIFNFLDRQNLMVKF